MKKFILKSNLRVIMAHRGIKTLTEVAELTNLARGTIYKLDKGDLSLNLSVIAHVCEVLNCTFNELLTFDETEV